MKRYQKKLLLILMALTPMILVVLVLVLCPYSKTEAPTKESKLIASQNECELILLFHSDTEDLRKQDILRTIPVEYTIRQNFDNYMLLSFSSTSNAAAGIAALHDHNEVLAVDYNSSVTLCQTDDTYSSTQWAFDNPGFYYKLIGDKLVELSSCKDVDLNLLEAFQAYNLDKTSNEVVVAVIDTGIDNNHPDLVNSMWVNTGEIPDDGIDNDNNGYIDDIFGWDFYNKDNTICHYEIDDSTQEITSASDDLDNHGTHVAGIIAASANNQEGIAGVASNVNAKLMSLKIHGGHNGKGTISDAILAIKYATMMGAKICNLSWGSEVYNEALKQAIATSPMLFVTAAGNGGMNNDITPMYPAGYQLPNLISVTFINAYGALTERSNYGVSSVDFAAPGTDILSTVVGSYATMSGSSMAAPHITGLAAMIYSYNSHIAPSQAKELIINSINPLPGLDKTIKYPGIPDALKIVNALPTLMTDQETPALSIIASYNKDSLELSFLTSDNGGSNIRLVAYLPGDHEIEDFKKGTDGMVIENNRLSLIKAGIYTFYISDYAGNESIYKYEVLDDTRAPIITSSFHYSMNNKILTIDLTVSDKQSGVRTVKYLPGERSLDDFKPAFSGIPLTLDNNKATLRFDKSGIYTIYAIDYRGNRTVHTIHAIAKPIETLSIDNSSLTMETNQNQKLNVSYTPFETTDRIYYMSSNPNIVSISQWGMLHAKSAGKAVITVRSSGGMNRKIIITVK